MQSPMPRIARMTHWRTPESLVALKRPDEKFVTEKAYDNPRFVEDMVREVAMAFDRESRIISYEIEVENQESIHAHNAYACLKRTKEEERR